VPLVPKPAWVSRKKPAGPPLVAGRATGQACLSNYRFFGSMTMLWLLDFHSEILKREFFFPCHGFSMVPSACGKPLNPPGALTKFYSSTYGWVVRGNATYWGSTLPKGLISDDLCQYSPWVCFLLGRLQISPGEEWKTLAFPGCCIAFHLIKKSTSGFSPLPPGPKFYAFDKRWA